MTGDTSVLSVHWSISFNRNKFEFGVINIMYMYLIGNMSVKTTLIYI